MPFKWQTLWVPLVPMLRNHKMAKHPYTDILAGAMQSEQQWAKQPSQIQWKKCLLAISIAAMVLKFKSLRLGTFIVVKSFLNCKNKMQ